MKKFTDTQEQLHVDHVSKDVTGVSACLIVQGNS